MAALNAKILLNLAQGSQRTNSRIQGARDLLQLAKAKRYGTHSKGFATFEHKTNRKKEGDKKYTREFNLVKNHGYSQNQVKKRIQTLRKLKKKIQKIVTGKEGPKGPYLVKNTDINAIDQALENKEFTFNKIAEIERKYDLLPRSESKRREAAQRAAKKGVNTKREQVVNTRKTLKELLQRVTDAKK